MSGQSCYQIAWLPWRCKWCNKWNWEDYGQSCKNKWVWCVAIYNMLLVIQHDISELFTNIRESNLKCPFLTNNEYVVRLADVVEKDAGGCIIWWVGKKEIRLVCQCKQLLNKYAIKMAASSNQVLIKNYWRKTWWGGQHPILGAVLEV